MRTSTIGRTATTVYTDDDGTHVQYHATRVVSFDADTITLRSGGWETATTKTRMNQTANQHGLGFYVYQRDHVWYVTKPNGETVEFVDGMTFSRHTEPVAA